MLAARALLGAPAPAGDSVIETEPLVAVDGGTMTLLRSPQDSAGTPALRLTFGHPAERARWSIAAAASEIGALLDTLERLGPRSRLSPPGPAGYVNPTHRRTTPDREPAASRFGTLGESGEVWAMAELDPAGVIRRGSARVLWASTPALAEAVRRGLGAYRYRRHDGGRPAALWIYQRVRVERASRR
jgi:hypothetical protein